MKILILGGTGMLGHKLLQTLGNEHDTWVTIRRNFADVERFGIFDPAKTLDGLDVTDFEALRNVIDSVRPDVVLNAIGIIKQLDTPKALNEILPHKLAEFSREFGFRLICISTDCVFSGEKGNYNESDKPDATDDYGITKAKGEVTGANCLTVRTSIIGRELDTSHSLVEWFLSNKSGSVKGFSRVIYTGFPTIIFAQILSDIILNQPHLEGLYHISSDPISKYHLLELLNKCYDASVEIVRETEMVNDRSLDSSKYRTQTGFAPLSWESMVKTMAADKTDYDRIRSTREL